MFVSPDLNLTYYQYTGDRGDSAMIQLTKDRDAEKLSLYAFIREKMLPQCKSADYDKLLIIDSNEYFFLKCNGDTLSPEVTSIM